MSNADLLLALLGPLSLLVLGLATLYFTSNSR